MANIKIPDADGLPKYIASTGAGSDVDPILLRRAVDGMGEVQANPTANTLLARIKSLEDKLADVKTAVEALAVASPDTAAGDLADINIASASIDGKLPAIGQQLKAASLSIVPASDADDVKVSLDSEVVAINGGVGQTDDIKVTLDSESVAVTGPLTDTELRASDVKVTLDSESVAVTGPLTDTELRASDVKVTLDSESVAVTGPLTDAQLTTQALAKEATLASMSADLGTVQTDLDTIKADIALMKTDLAAILAILES